MLRRTLRNVTIGVAIAGLAAFLLSGCSDHSAVVAETNVSGHILMSDAQHEDAAPGSKIEGTLTLVGSCFGLDTGTGDFAAVFPLGSKLVENTDQVEIPGWGTLAPDDHYQGGGGILDSATLNFHDTIPAECHVRIIVLNPIR